MKNLFLGLIALFAMGTASAQLNLELSPGYNFAKVEVSGNGVNAEVAGDVFSTQLGLHYDFIEGPALVSAGIRGYGFFGKGITTIAGGAEVKAGLDAIHAIGGIDLDGGLLVGLGGDIPLGDSKFALAPSVRYTAGSDSASGIDIKASAWLVGLGVNYQF